MSANKINNANQVFATKAFVMVIFLILNLANSMKIVLTWYVIKKFVEFLLFLAIAMDYQVILFKI
jgi:hypothetical protein